MSVSNNGNNGSGYTTIVATGIPQLLVPSSLPCTRLDLRALKTNSQDIVVGGNGIVLSPVAGIPLHPDEIYNLDVITDAKNVIIVGTAGDIITYNWWIGS
jgi:hypothetical protein